MTAFTDTWNTAFEALPANTEDASQGASRIRELKVALSERIEVDHSLAGDVSDGEHLKVTLSAQGSDPTPPSDNGDRAVLYVKEVSGSLQLFFVNEAATVHQITNADGFSSGTRMFFFQASAPTGWTKLTTSAYNEAAIRMTTGTGGGTGGSDNFSTVFSSSRSTESHTLTLSQIPSHTHTYTTTNNKTGGGISQDPYNRWIGNGTTVSTGSAGSGGGHSHTIDDMNIKYMNTIVCEKD